MHINKLLTDSYNKLTNSKLYSKLSKFFDYNNINNIRISDILIHKIDIEDKFNILLELELYINREIKLLESKNNIYTNYSNIQNISISIVPDYIFKYYKELKKILTGINDNLDNKSKRYPSNRLLSKLREYLDINEYSNTLKQQFFAYLKNTGKIDSGSSLLLNPYTSILNLHYIYLDTEYYITYKSEMHYKDIYYTIELKDIILYGPSNNKLIKCLINNTNKSYVFTYLKDISSRVFMFKYLLNTVEKPENIQIYLTNYNKEFMTNISLDKESINKFTSSEINTGVTNGRQIIITREEESMKTLIHELIHFYNMDFRHIPEFIKEWVFGNFNLESYSSGEMNNDIYIFESYTEFIASIIHIISRVYNNNDKQLILLKNSGKIKVFLKILKEQITYTFNKCCQILAVSKCDSFDKIRNTSSSDKMCTLLEDTNVFCYYYLKLCMYLNLGEVLTLCDSDTGQFFDTDKSFKKLLRIFKSCSNNTLFSSHMTKCIKKYFKYYKNSKNKQLNSLYNKNKHQASKDTKTLNTAGHLKSKIIKTKYDIKTLKMVVID
jgi:hypothetical protein